MERGAHVAHSPRQTSAFGRRARICTRVSTLCIFRLGLIPAVFFGDEGRSGAAAEIEKQTLEKQHAR